MKMWREPKAIKEAIAALERTRNSGMWAPPHPDLPMIASVAAHAAIEALFPRRDEVLAAYPWANNSDLIFDLWRMGHVRGHVYDATPGHDGLWWRRLISPEGDVADGIDSLTLNGISDGERRDFRETYYNDEAFNTVAYDPPYKFNGNPDGLPELSERYGVDVPAKWQDRLLMMVDGLLECIRLTAPGGKILVKCQDQVVSGQLRWQTRTLTNVAEMGIYMSKDEPTGWRHVPKARLVDRFDMLGHHIPQPMNGRKQKHAHGRPSTLLVFERIQEDKK